MEHHATAGVNGGRSRYYPAGAPTRPLHVGERSWMHACYVVPLAGRIQFWCLVLDNVPCACWEDPGESRSDRSRSRPAQNDPDTRQTPIRHLRFASNLFYNAQLLLVPYTLYKMIIHQKQSHIKKELHVPRWSMFGCAATLLRAGLISSPEGRWGCITISKALVQNQLLSPRIRRASCKSLAMMVTRPAWIASRLVSSNSPTR